MGTQTAIVEKNRSRRADYVLVLKGNQTSLYDDVRTYFEGAESVKRDEQNASRQQIRWSRG